MANPAVCEQGEQGEQADISTLGGATRRVPTGKTELDGARMANGSRVLVTGAPIPVEHVPVGNGEMPAVVVDISAARAIGYRPVHDLETGMATVWPDFNPNHSGARVAETRA
jgi:hypothetical protein